MSRGDLGLLMMTQEAQNKAASMDSAYAHENRRRKKSGSWGGWGSLLGGIAGTLLMNAILPGSSILGGFLAKGAGKALGTGLGAAAGSMLGAGLGTQWAGGMKDQAGSLGDYESVLGGRREFTEDEKNLFSEDLAEHSEDVNQMIINKAISTGVKAGMLDYTNPLSATATPEEIAAAEEGTKAITELAEPIHHSRNAAGFTGHVPISSAVEDTSTALGNVWQNNIADAIANQGINTGGANYFSDSPYWMDFDFNDFLNIMPSARKDPAYYKNYMKPY